MSEDWDLFAVVRSCSSSVSTASINTNDRNSKEEDTPPLFRHIHGEREFSSCNELEDSCKPFLAATSVVSAAAGNVSMKQEEGVLEPEDEKPPPVFQASTAISSSVFVFRGQREQLLQQSSQAPLRSRKRKNQQKRTICHVTQENLSSDMWAWRKYGQKPIKGSPYPRNYYRCSSSKGCLARKQVERSNLDPNIFLVTYTGEHTHPRPTHRNSLAGSTRNKSHPIPKPDPSSLTLPKQEIHHSPTTPLKGNEGANGDEDIISQEVNMEDEEEDEDDDDDVDDLLIPNLAVTDRHDFFSIMEGFPGNFPPSWSAGSAGDGGG